MNPYKRYGLRVAWKKQGKGVEKTSSYISAINTFQSIKKKELHIHKVQIKLRHMYSMYDRIIQYFSLSLSFFGVKCYTVAG